MNYYNCFFNIKMNNKTNYYQKNEEKLLNQPKEYYENKESFQEQARNKYGELPNEDTN